MVDSIKLYTQPAQSPDLNVCDLGFFASLQAHYYRTSPKDAIELIEMVKLSYTSYPAEKLNRIWLTLQSCMNEIIEDGGGNRYKIPHLNKERLEREGRLPTVLSVTDVADHYPLEELLL